MKKTFIILFAILIVAPFATVEAQKKKKKGKEEVVVVTEEEKMDSDECNMYVSIFYESARIKNYADALEAWEIVYKNCPTANRVIFTQGERIVQWQIENAVDQSSKDMLVQKLLNLYDDQYKYYGENQVSQKANFDAKKAFAHFKYYPEDVETPYKWYKEYVETEGVEYNNAYLQQFITISYKKYEMDKDGQRDNFISDYLKVVSLIEDTPESSKYYAALMELKPAIDALFITSGAADCEQMNVIYDGKIAENKTDIDYLIRTIRFFRRVGCTQSPIYFEALNAAYTLTPTAEIAEEKAIYAETQKEWNNALAFYKEAAEKTDNDKKAANYYFKMARIYQANLNNPQRSREYCRLSLDKQPDQGAPYILIGLLYAGSKPIYDNATLNKTVFWVAVDKFRKAKEVDSEMTEKADELIRTYSKYFPTQEEIFFLPELNKGASFTVGGWIGESTICR